ncbi:hypothetical protein C1I63_11265 [Rathayibacter caricis DSM 15933]|uniref:Uncharacterized protein n=1 Tax=Rathayibacter caricis DSM 15933 TaxID=1328867 RepID=A0A2T4UV23_9MICO|nr:hypothetical protein C1I63_11265 [Rathayibacter caricis DSM 15933]
MPVWVARSRTSVAIVCHAEPRCWRSSPPSARIRICVVALPAAICVAPLVVPRGVAPPPSWWRVTTSSPVEPRTTETTSSSSVQPAVTAVPRVEARTTGSPTATGSPPPEREIPATRTDACSPSCTRASIRVPSLETESEAIVSISDHAVAIWNDSVPSGEYATSWFGAADGTDHT